MERRRKRARRSRGEANCDNFAKGNSSLDLYALNYAGRQPTPSSFPWAPSHIHSCLNIITGKVGQMHDKVFVCSKQEAVNRPGEGPTRSKASKFPARRSAEPVFPICTHVRTVIDII